MLLLEASPVLVTILVLVLRRGRMIEAGLAGLVVAALLALWLLPPEAGSAAFLLGAVGRGSWLAWHAAAVMLAGLLFFETVRAGAVEPEAAPSHDHRLLWAACFLLGPFFETAIGFGIGLVIVVPVLRRLGLDGALAVIFGLFSQMLVPWGALAIGTMLGAELAGLDAMALGTASAWLTAPLLALYLVAFWLLAAWSGRRPSAAAMLDDLAWTALLWLLLLAANRFIAVDVAALVACGALLPVRWWRDARPDGAAWRRLAGHAAPYAALTIVLLAVRAVPPIAAMLRGLWVWRPWGDLAPFSPFHHVAFWITATAIAVGLAQGLPAMAWRRILGAWMRRAARPVGVTFIFLAIAELMTESGASRQLAAGLADGLGTYALAVSPTFAAVAGLLTGSNVASNALLMPLQTALAAGLGGELRWVAALQNVAGSNFTLLSPIRVAMGCALLGGGAAREAGDEVYRRMAPLAPALLVLLAAIGAVIGWHSGR